MASSTTVPMAHERKIENLRAFTVNLASSRGFSLPETKLFERKFLDLCLSSSPDHPTYSAMIFNAITELNEEGGSGEKAISEFIKSKYKNLPFAHTSLLSHHLAKLVIKTEILCDYRNCYTLPVGNTSVSAENERKSGNATDAQRDAEKEHQLKMNWCVASDDMTCQNENENFRYLQSENHNIDRGGDCLEESNLTDSETGRKGKACGGILQCESGLEENYALRKGVNINVTDLRHSETNGVKISLDKSQNKQDQDDKRREINEVVNLDEQNDVIMEESREEESHEQEVMERISKQRKTNFARRSNRMSEECVEVALERKEMSEESEAYKRLCESQTEACGNIIALKKMLKRRRKKDLQNEAVSEIDGSFRSSSLPLSKKSCKKLWKFVHKIQGQLSEIIDTFDKSEVLNYEPQSCEMESITKGFFQEGHKRTIISPSKQFETKEREIDSQQKNPHFKETTAKSIQAIETIALRKSPLGHKQRRLSNEKNAFILVPDSDFVSVEATGQDNRIQPEKIVIDSSFVLALPANPTTVVPDRSQEGTATKPVVKIVRSLERF